MNPSRSRTIHLRHPFLCRRKKTCAPLPPRSRTIYFFVQQKKENLCTIVARRAAWARGDGGGGEWLCAAKADPSNFCGLSQDKKKMHGPLVFVL